MPNLQKRKPLSHLVWLQALEAEYPEEFLICRTSKKEVRNQIHGKCIYQFNQKADEPCFSIELELEEGACEFSISRKEVPEAAATGISRESKTASAESKGRRRARNATWAGVIKSSWYITSEAGERPFEDVGEGKWATDCPDGEVGVGAEELFAEMLVSESPWASAASAIASSTRRIERTTLSWTTALQERRSARNARGEFISWKSANSSRVKSLEIWQ